AEQLLVLQQLDIVPGVLLGAVDLGGAPGDGAACKFAHACLQLQLIGREGRGVHRAVSWPLGSTLKIAIASDRPRTGTSPRAWKTKRSPQRSRVLCEAR